MNAIGGHISWPLEADMGQRRLDVRERREAPQVPTIMDVVASCVASSSMHLSTCTILLLSFIGARLVGDSTW